MRLGKILYRWRVMEDINLRTAAKKIGIDYVTLMRLEHGHDPSAKTLAKILNWILEPDSSPKEARSRAAE